MQQITHKRGSTRRTGFSLIELSTPACEIDTPLPLGEVEAFTLIELLVVITIIVIVLTLLTPAIEKATYHAEMLTCAARQDAIMTGASTYAVDFRRRYPYRGACDDVDANYGPAWVKNNGTPVSEQWQAAPTDFTYGAYDDRVVMKGYIEIPLMLCPLTQKVDISFEGVHPESWVGIPYTFWFGFHYDFGAGLTRLGQKLSINPDYDPTNKWTFEVMVADADGTNSGSTSYSAHRDSDRVLVPQVLQNVSTVEGAWDQTSTLWVKTQSGRAGVGTPRGTLDRNVGFVDGSVSRFDKIGFHPVDAPTDPNELADHPMRPLPFTEWGEPTAASMSGYAYWMPLR